ncbi:hypothetical protein YASMINEVIRUS_364 [Yasminevirus sp. GU-2018]|uniref:Uncharacterized protein n=1 Tax=Yasminevirus sp. GU-2018 TaxID=2420051 RepID=A0A5K0U8P4_9VIRU|nr:hypothetical protein YASMINEVIRUS_364 [Yasminevirus sp. GU-2018]
MSYAEERTFRENIRVTGCDLSWPDIDSSLQFKTQLYAEDVPLTLRVDVRSIFANRSFYDRCYILALVSTSSLGDDCLNTPLQTPLYAKGTVTRETDTITFTFEDTDIPLYKNLLCPCADLSQVTDLNSFDEINAKTTYSFMCGKTDFYNFVMYTFNPLTSLSKAIDAVGTNYITGIPISYYYNSNAICDVKTERLIKQIINTGEHISFEVERIPHCVTQCQAQKPEMIPYIRLKYPDGFQPKKKVGRPKFKNYLVGGLIKITSNQPVQVFLPF